LIAQNFNIGYKDGFKEGFCMDKNNNTGTYLGCVAPVVTPPYPRSTESINNYLDGYNRGLVDGVRRKEQNSKSTNINSSYYIPEYKPFTPDLEFYYKLMKQKSENVNKTQNNYTENNKTSSELGNNIKEFYENYNSNENTEIRKRYIQLLDATYSSFSNYPTKIPNGVYNVTVITLNNKFNHINENSSVIVQDNKIISVRNKNEWDLKSSYTTSYSKSYFPRYNFTNLEFYKDLGINSLDNNITNGIVNYSVDFFYNNKKDKSYYKIYFNDFIRDYNNCLEKLEKLKQDRAAKNLNKKVLDGWQTAIMTNNVEFFVVRKVYIQNNKLIKWIGSQGDEIIVDSGGEINYLNTTVIKIWPKFSDEVLWENTFLYKEKKEIYDVYFE
jgi:hypothetical protein